MTALSPLEKVESLPLHELVERWSEAQARPCLCGGTILTNVIEPSEGIRVHQKTERHAEWAERVYG